jgi:hypothetical protein
MKIRTLVKKAALPAIALTLAASATSCLADTKAHANRRKPTKAETAYYQHKAGNSWSQIQWAPVGKPSNWEQP